MHRGCNREESGGSRRRRKTRREGKTSQKCREGYRRRSVGEEED